MNPPDEPGYTQMYTFGVELRLYNHVERLVITVRAATKDMAEHHIVSIFAGNYKHAELTFYSDLDEWNKIANTKKEKTDDH